MDGRRHLARRARHAAIGHQCHLETPVLQHPQHGREFVQLGHAIGLRALMTHHGDKIFLQQTVFEQLLQCLLAVDHHSRCAHHPVFGLHSRHLHHRTAQIACQQTQTPIGTEWFVDGAQHGFIGRHRGHRSPSQLAVVQPWFLGVVLQTCTHDGVHIVVQQTSLQQLRH